MSETPLTALIRPAGPAISLEEYRQAGGYRALQRALTTMTPADVRNLVTESGLRGRGGAGFPTGAKWSFVPQGPQAPTPRYFVVNADEMEPGTFKDRLLLEGNPHQLLEGIMISAYAIGAETAFVFLRAEYVQAAEILEQAMQEARLAGLLGRIVTKDVWPLEIILHRSAGRYICGEETGLLNALEGRRAAPRTKPPFPQISGLFGKPTIVNNAETVCNIPHIVSKGATWFRSLSRSSDSGTKLYGVSGRVKTPGLWELPMGTPLREILYEHAGGMLEGYALAGILPGGASTDFLTSDHLELSMDFDSVGKAGSRLGTGTMIILDDRTCPVAFVHNLIAFFARESCGWCTPCREGLPWIEKTLAAIEQGQGLPEDLQMLVRHTRLLAPGNTYCALAPGAMEPLQSALNYFRTAFERHIGEHRCPWN